MSETREPNFLEVTHIPTSEPGIHYRTDFDHDRHFPKVVKRREQVDDAIHKLDPSADADRLELLGKIDRRLLEPPYTTKERAAILLEHAFCNENGQQLPAVALTDYRVRRLNDLYDEKMAEIEAEGKRSLEAARGNILPMPPSAD